MADPENKSPRGKGGIHEREHEREDVPVGGRARVCAGAAQEEEEEGGGRRQKSPTLWAVDCTSRHEARKGVAGAAERLVHVAFVQQLVALLAEDLIALVQRHLERARAQRARVRCQRALVAAGARERRHDLLVVVRGLLLAHERRLPRALAHLGAVVHEAEHERHAAKHNARDRRPRQRDLRLRRLQVQLVALVPLGREPVALRAALEVLAPDAVRDHALAGEPLALDGELVPRLLREAAREHHRVARRVAVAAAVHHLRAGHRLAVRRVLDGMRRHRPKVLAVNRREQDRFLQPPTYRTQASGNEQAPHTHTTDSTMQRTNGFFGGRGAIEKAARLGCRRVCLGVAVRHDRRLGLRGETAAVRDRGRVDRRQRRHECGVTEVERRARGARGALDARVRARDAAAAYWVVVRPVLGRHFHGVLCCLVEHNARLGLRDAHERQGRGGDGHQRRHLHRRHIVALCRSRPAGAAAARQRRMGNECEPRWETTGARRCECSAFDIVYRVPVEKVERRNCRSRRDNTWAQNKVDKCTVFWKHKAIKFLFVTAKKCRACDENRVPSRIIQSHRLLEQIGG
ncbi:hypothetical protein PybrP1_009240 [[Pythium] brassicae (nom. inval.)]|nr:hypothetical protein PybrP1_009240 [[Pythium] brassicae (nom. inval.)]